MILCQNSALYMVDLPRAIYRRLQVDFEEYVGARNEA
jgi:hypothetical protein